MRRVAISAVVIVVVAIALISFVFRNPKSPSLPTQLRDTQKSQDNQKDFPRTEIIAKNLDTPWGIAFLPDGNLLVTERKGTIVLVDKDVISDPIQVGRIESVREAGEGGLLGITLHPDFETNNFVYLYYTYSLQGNNTLNRVVRVTYENQSMTNEKIILDRIPGASNHNGGRIKFGPDGNLYITTGDAQEPSLSQSTQSLAGKILRVTDEGEAVAGNPFDNRIFSYGHRNPQGLSWDVDGNLWSTEHGPSGGTFGSGNDEVNRIEIGKNYGWPVVQGDEEKISIKSPFVHSGREVTWAPGGNAIIGSTLYFSGLRGGGLYSLQIDDSTKSITKHFDNEYGRIREVIEGPDGMIYITTSNRDGRGIPKSGDDKIIRINPSKL